MLESTQTQNQSLQRFVSHNCFNSLPKTETFYVQL